MQVTRQLGKPLKNSAFGARLNPITRLPYLSREKSTETRSRHAELGRTGFSARGFGSISTALEPRFATPPQSARVVDTEKAEMMRMLTELR